MRQIQKLGLRVIIKLWRIVSFFIPFPIAVLFILLFPFYRIKLIGLFSDRIGHYAMNTELLLCHLDQVKKNEKRTTYLFYIREAPICNVQLHKMWKRVIKILFFTKIAENVDKMMQYVLGFSYKNNILRNFEITVGYPDMAGNLQKYPPHLFFLQDELYLGKKLLLDLGISSGAKFVCLLVRDMAYLNAYLPGNDWSYHSYRDCHIKNFYKAALFLAKKGYFVIRMGKEVDQSFEVDHPNIIDYAKNPLRSDFADIYLSAHCTFFIATPSGLDAVPKIFRRPVLLVNVSPFKHSLEYWYPCKLFIIKKVFDNTQKRFISLKEIDSVFMPESDPNKVLEQLNWSMIENNEDEIFDVVYEMECLASGEKTEIKNNPFHEILKNKSIFSMISDRVDRYILTSHPEKFYIRMGNKFWCENHTLFQ